MNKYLKVPTHNPNVCIRILQLNTANPFRRSVMAGPSLLQPPPCRGGVISVHHDPVHGIVTNPGNREWEPFPLSFFVVCPNPIHRVMYIMVNWDPPISQLYTCLVESKTVTPLYSAAPTREGILLRRAGSPLHPFWPPRMVRPRYAGPQLSSFLIP